MQKSPWQLRMRLFQRFSQKYTWRMRQSRVRFSWLYRDGQHIVAKIFRAGTNHAYNLDHKTDQVSLQIAIMIIMGANMLVISRTDRICLQSFSIGTKYACNQQNSVFRNNSHVILGRFPTLQAYLVIIKKDCKHVLSVSDLRLQPYLVSSWSRLQHIGSSF